MNNNVKLTDDELALIATALQTTIMSHEKYVQVKGAANIDHATLEAIAGMRALLERLHKEQF